MLIFFCKLHGTPDQLAQGVLRFLGIPAILPLFPRNPMKVNGYEIEPGANLEGATLRDAYLEGAKLSDANLQDADLRDAILWGSNLECANLGGANLQGANLRGANLRNANLRYANLRNACLEDAILEDANVTETILEKKEEPQDDKDLKIQQLEEELEMYKNKFNQLKALLDG